MTHLAAALGVRCVVLWGETNRDVWRPPQDHVTVLEGGKGLKEISVDAVLAAVRPRAHVDFYEMCGRL